jgi:hypothetical protein
LPDGFCCLTVFAASQAWLLHAAAGCSQQDGDGAPGVSDLVLLTWMQVAEVRCHVLFADSAAWLLHAAAGCSEQNGVGMPGMSMQVLLPVVA